MALARENGFVQISSSFQTAPPLRGHRNLSVHALPPQGSASPAPSQPADTYRSAQGQVRVVVLDDFTNASRAGVTTHGELVETELLRNQPGLQVTRGQVALDGDQSAILQGRTGSLDQFFRGQFRTRLDNASDAWAQLLEAPGGRAVIHQSQGASQSRAVEPLWGRAQGDLGFRNQLERQLGLPTSSGQQMTGEERARLLRTLVSRSDSIHRRDPAVRESIEELRLLQSEAAERGHVHVISAGNQGALAREMQQLGVPIPQGFFRNELVSPDSIVVGAADDGTRQARSEQAPRVADIASPNAGAMISADAVDRPMMVEGQLQHHSGSSYAAPQVSSLVIDMLREHPDLTRDEVLGRLRSQATPLQGQERYVGAGVVAYRQ